MSKTSKTKTSGNKRNTKVSSKTTTATNKKVSAPVATPRTTKTTYVAVSHNIYYDGTSYRVRVTRDNVRTSKNFSSKRKAMEFRKTLLANN